MKKTLLPFAFLFLLLSCQKEIEKSGPDESLLYGHWEKIAHDPATGVTTYFSNPDLLYGYEIAPQKQAIYHSVYPICGNDGCYVPFYSEDEGTFDYDKDNGILSIDIPDLPSANKTWEVISTNKDFLKVIER